MFINTLLGQKWFCTYKALCHASRERLTSTQAVASSTIFGAVSLYFQTCWRHLGRAIDMHTQRLDQNWALNSRKYWVHRRARSVLMQQMFVMKFFSTYNTFLIHCGSGHWWPNKKGGMSLLSVYCELSHCHPDGRFWTIVHIVVLLWTFWAVQISICFQLNQFPNNVCPLYQQTVDWFK